MSAEHAHVTEVSLEEARELFGPANMSRMRTFLASVLPDDGLKRMVYICPLGGRIGHVAIESHQIYNMYREACDELVFMTNMPGDVPVNLALMELVGRYYRVVYCPDYTLLRMGFFDMEPLDLGIATLIMRSPAGVQFEYYLHCLSGAKLVYFELPEHLTAKRDALCQTLGMPSGARVVTVHVRDSSYFSNVHYDSSRSTSLDGYLAMITMLLERGYWVARIGDANMPKLPMTHERLIDAPFHDARTEFMDLCLIAASEFTVMSASGPEAIPRMLNIPAVHTNAVIHHIHSPNPRDLILPRHYVRISDGEHFSYANLLLAGLALKNVTSHYEERDARLEENSVDEITSAVEEMIDRLAGTFDSDPAIDERFHMIGKAYEQELRALVNESNTPIAQMQPCYAYSAPNARLAHSFVRLNPGYLDL